MRTRIIGPTAAFQPDYWLSFTPSEPRTGKNSSGNEAKKNLKRP